MPKIKSDAYYSPLMMFKMRMFMWIKSYDTMKRWIKKDINNGNILFRTIQQGTGTATRYLIKGDRILRVLNLVKKGRLTTHK